MHKSILLLASIFIWIIFLFVLYQRFVQIPKWFSNPPHSFEFIRQVRSRMMTFYASIAFLFISSAVTGLFMNWNHEEARTHVIGSLVCFVLAGTIGAKYLIKEILAFATISSDTPQTKELHVRVKNWKRWTIPRDILLFFSAIFVSIAWNHV